jgi:hypothetical protein
VNCSIRQNNHYVDLVVGKACVQETSEMIQHFDLDICKATWNGKIYQWHNAVNTFQSNTLMDPWTNKLMTAFIHGWRQNTGYVDEHASLTSFLQSARWLLAAKSGLKAIKEYYEPEIWNRLWLYMLQPTEKTLFAFVCREFGRFAKYGRRGIVIRHLPPFLDIWIALQYVQQIQYEE